MKTQTDSQITFSSKNLHELVGIAAGNMMPAAVQKNSFIVNEVPREFKIATNETILSTILTNLLTTIVGHSKHNCIRIKAKEYEDVVFVSIKDSSSISNYINNNNLKEVQILAKKMNGSLSIEHKEEKFITILLSFPNFPKAA